VRAFLVVAVLGLTLAGCQRAPAPAPAASAPAETVGSRTERLKSEGDQLLKEGRYDEAALKYQTALNEAPSDIPIRFGLAVALSHRPRRAETVEHFRIVMQRGTPGSAEVKTAYEWLAQAGELGEAAPAAAAPPPSSLASDPKKGRVLGKIRWNDIEPYKKRVAIKVSLIGDDVETREVRMERPDFKIGWSYEFRNVPPGAYRLVAEAGGTPMWDLKLEVPAEKDTTLDLNEGNAGVPREFTPTSSH
jgi:tetratricopeptide (TPR) repeat protein